MAMAATHRQDRAAYKRDTLHPNAMILVERALLENVVFSKANVRFGSYTQEYFNNWYMEIINAYQYSTPDLFIYLHACERVRWHRQKERDRLDEDKYEKEYHSIMRDCYFEFVLEHAEKKRLLVLNWNEYGNMRKVIRTVADVLSGARALPTVTRTELASSGESSDETQPQQIAVKVEGKPLCYHDTSTAKKRELAQDLIIEALARFEDVEIRS